MMAKSCDMAIALRAIRFERLRADRTRECHGAVIRMSVQQRLK
jgi:hypothetical protein